MARTKVKRDDDESPETAGDRFKRLAEARVRKALNALRLIGNLGNYPHTHQHTEKIMEFLKSAVESVEYRLGGEAKEKDKGFSLGDNEDDE